MEKNKSLPRLLLRFSFVLFVVFPAHLFEVAHIFDAQEEYVVLLADAQVEAAPLALPSIVSLSFVALVQVTIVLLLAVFSLALASFPFLKDLVLLVITLALL
ncbi:hypothetical protein BD770DRAFT_383383 [Pilaira anomala]|nr:hypothetical protein BD770DRAFT_383383 [Pilaira anomala]